MTALSAARFHPHGAAVADQWAAMHRDILFAVHDCEVHYLTAIALASADDLVAHLLLKKLKLARKVGNDEAASLVRMNSLVEYEDGSGRPRMARLLHPSVRQDPHGVSIASMAGAGLIGLGEGQAIRWPDEGSAR